MRKIIASVRVTLDGFIAGPHGEIDWMEEYLDEALANYESELQKTVDTTLFGRVTCHQTRRVNADGLASPCESVDCIQPLFNGTRYDG